MLKKYTSVILTAVMSVAFFMSGCMNVECFMEETYPPTEEVRKFDKAVEIPYEYTVIGVCQTEGNYTEFSYDDMMVRMENKAKDNGADGIVVLGMRVVPSGRVVQTSPLRSSLGSSPSASGDQWGEISKDFGGGYGSIRSKSFGSAPTYDRIIRAQFVRFKRDANGEFVQRTSRKSSEQDVAAPIKTINEMKKEKKNAAAN